MAIKEDILTSMILNAPNPDEPLPLANRRETIYGTTVTFLVRIDA